MPRPLVPAPLARGASAAVVAPHHLATTAGLGILRAGGSAVDAAIATNAVLAVVFGEACGIGGDAFWLIWDEASASQVALNGSGRAPASADAGALRARGLTTLPFRGPLSITVPGAVRSWGDAHARFGRLPWADLLAPAIELAGGGFPADEHFARSVEGSAAIFDRELGAGARGWAATYRPLGRPWQPGERVRLPALAATLERLASAGADDLYVGELAARQAAGLAAAGSGITAADLAAHASTWESPLAIGYRGATATTHPPNSSGLVGLEILNILRRSSHPSPRHSSRATAVRRPAPTCAGPTSGSRRRSAPSPIATPTCLIPRSSTCRSRGCWTRRTATPWPAASIPAAPPRRPPSRAPSGGGTIWLGVVDPQGNAVSLIESNYSGFGSGIVDPATGIAYQNRGSYFSLDPDHPNVLAPAQADAAHPAPRDALPGRAALGRAREHGRRRPARDLRPGGLGAGGRRGRRRHGGRRAALVAGLRRRTSPRPTSCRSSRASGPGSSRGWRPWDTTSTSGSRSTALSATPTRSSSSPAGRPRGGTLAAATDPRSPGLAAAW